MAGATVEEVITRTVAPPALVDELRAALGRDRVRTGATELNLYGRDASNMEGATAVVVFPTSTAEVQACVVAARNHQTPFVARGSGTGLAGGAVPMHGAVVIVTTKMNRILSVDLDSRQAWVEPGVLNADLSRQLASHGVHYAPDPSSQQSCSVGGNVATNAGGPHCLSEGVTAMHILAVEVVLPGRDRDGARRARTRSPSGSTSAASSSAARGCSASPPGYASASCRTLRWSGPSCWTSSGSRTARRR